MDIGKARARAVEQVVTVTDSTTIGRPATRTSRRPGSPARSAAGAGDAAAGRAAATMNPSRLFINLPVATSLLMVAVLLSGLFAFKFLPLSSLPEVDYPTIQVQTFYPGASPEVMTSSVTAPLERQFGQMPGLNQMTSASSGGASVITLQFSLDLGLDVAEQEVQAAINAAGNVLPNDLPTPPTYAKFNPADAPIMTLAVTSDNAQAHRRRGSFLHAARAEDLAAAGRGRGEHLRRAAAGGAHPVQSARAREVRAQHRRSAHHHSNANGNSPKGSFDGPSQSSSLNANDQITDIQGYRDIIVAYSNGSPVHMSDVANVIMAPENNKLAAWANGTPALILNIQRQPGANVIQVANAVKRLLPQVKADMPPALDITVLSDRTETIRASVADVEFELILAVILVVLVIFVFLRNAPATIIPSLSVPLSLVGTFGVMYLLNYSLDNLSLMALTISTGFVVDDAIVMIENIARYIEAGDAPLAAALKGSQQIGFTIISLTVSLIAALIPLLFMGEIVGRLFHEFAITLAVTIVISAVVSLTLVPMLCARLLHHRPQAARGAWDLRAERGFQWIIGRYERALSLGARPPGRSRSRSPASLCVVTLLLYVFIPKGFFPVQDTGEIQGISEAAQTISYPAMAERQQALAAAILKDPDVQSLSSFIGVDGTNSTLNSGRFLINLKPYGARSASASEIIRRLTRETAGVVGITLYMQPLQDITIDSAVSRTQYQFVVESTDNNDFAAWIPPLDAEIGVAPRARGCRQRPGATGHGHRPRHRPRHGRAFRHHAGDRGQRALRFVRAAHRVDDLLAVESIPRHPRGGPGHPALARRAVGALPAVLHLLEQRSGAAGGDRPRQPARGASADHAPRTVSRDHHLLQSCARRLARRCGRRHPQSRAGHQAAGQVRHRVPGHGSGVSARAHQPGTAARGIGDHDVYRARRALRELHSSDHDPLDAALGGHRRHARAHPGGPRSRRARHHRHHLADRHRQEERHHDDRLRARCAAQGRPRTARGDHPGIAAAVSSHPDDDDGGAARRVAADAELRRGIGVAPAARHRDRRRA